MNQHIINQALELQSNGYSIRQIASELNVSKSQVFRWLNGQSGNGGNALPIDLIAKATSTNQQLNLKNKEYTTVNEELTELMYIFISSMVNDIKSNPIFSNRLTPRDNTLASSTALEGLTI